MKVKIGSCDDHRLLRATKISECYHDSSFSYMLDVLPLLISDSWLNLASQNVLDSSEPPKFQIGFSSTVLHGKCGFERREYCDLVKN